MMNLLPKNNKKGVTLVESVFAVVILGIFAIGILTLLTSGGTKIQQISHEASVYTEATQKMDMTLSAISNGSSEYIEEVTSGGVTTVTLNISDLQAALGFDTSEVTITPTLELYDASAAATPSNVRGWYLELTYNGATVKGFASNSGGVFDNE